MRSSRRVSRLQLAPTPCRLAAAGALLVVSLSGCRTPPKTFATIDVPPPVAEPLVFEGEGAPNPGDPLVRELRELQGTISRQLELAPSSRTVHVHVFPDDPSYREFAGRTFPELADRRALFVEASGRLHVFTRWGEETAEDLRHEVTHGYLHASLAGLPLWLDEGLAEYYEVAPGGGGWNLPHAESLASLYAIRAWHPNLERLESLDRPGAMKQLDYAEAWAWTYWLLHGPEEARQVLREYLIDAETELPSPPLSVRLAARLEFEPVQKLTEMLMASQDDKL